MAVGYCPTLFHHPVVQIFHAVEAHSDEAAVPDGRDERRVEAGREGVARGRPQRVARQVGDGKLCPRSTDCHDENHAGRVREGESGRRPAARRRALVVIGDQTKRLKCCNPGR